MSKSSQIIAFAHRGASAYAPENTLAAFRLALEQGANGLESDTWLSLDGVPMLAHDDVIHRNGTEIRVRQTSCAALREQGVPALADLYQECGCDFDFSLDIQHPEVACTALAVAEQFGAAGRLWLCHDSLELLGELRRQSAAVRLVDSTRRRKIMGSLARTAERLAAAGINALNLHWTDWTPGLVHTVQSAGVRAFAWDAQSAEVIDQVLGYGVDALYSDYPDLLVKHIQKNHS